LATSIIASSEPHNYPMTQYVATKIHQWPPRMQDIVGQ
jgi:hypothetical protein